MSCIRSLSVLRLPPTPQHLGSDAVYIVTGAYDGSTKIMDTRDPLVPISLDRQRCMSNFEIVEIKLIVNQYRSCPPHGLPISRARLWVITNILRKSYGLRIGRDVRAGLSFLDIAVSSGLVLLLLLLLLFFFFFLLDFFANVKSRILGRRITIQW